MLRPYYENEHGVLYHGDCLDVMDALASSSRFIHLVVTSPPYDNLRTYNGYSFDFQKTADRLVPILINGGVIVWVVGDATVNGSETGSSFRQALYFKDNFGLNIHDTMVYQKPDFKPLTHNRYEQCFEFMFVLSKGKPRAFNPIKDKPNVGAGRKVTGTWRDVDGVTKKMSGCGVKEIAEYGMRNNVWTLKTEKGVGKSGHPAPFPVQLAADHIASWTNTGDTVFDPFMGSGTTAVAAEMLGRKWVGCEISEEYCEIIASRIEARKESVCVGSEIARSIGKEVVYIEK